MFPQPLSPRSTNYWAVGILFCFQISNLIVSLNLEMFSHLVTVKMCSLKERCLPTWMLMHKGSCCFLGLQESPFSSLALGKLGGIQEFGDLVAMSEHHSSPNKARNLTGTPSLHQAQGFSSEKDTHIISWSNNQFCLEVAGIRTNSWFVQAQAPHHISAQRAYPASRSSGVFSLSFVLKLVLSSQLWPLLELHCSSLAMHPVNPDPDLQNHFSGLDLDLLHQLQSSLVIWTLG